MDHTDGRSSIIIYELYTKMPVAIDIHVEDGRMQIDAQAKIDAK